MNQIMQLATRFALSTTNKSNTYDLKPQKQYFGMEEILESVKSVNNIAKCKHRFFRV